MKCKWCKDTGLYYPLVGEAEPCRECEVHSKLLWTPDTKTFFVPGGLTIIDRMIFEPKFYSADVTFTEEEIASLPNLDAINMATKHWIAQSRLVDQVFATGSIFGHIMKEFYLTPRELHVLGQE